jgi:hypothetical protein
VLLSDFLSESQYKQTTKELKMKILTDGKLMFMIVADHVYIEDLPTDFNDMNWEFDWSEQNPEIQSINDIKREFPFLFNKKHPFYIPNLKLVNVSKNDIK